MNDSNYMTTLNFQSSSMMGAPSVAALMSQPAADADLSFAHIIMLGMPGSGKGLNYKFVEEAFKDLYAFSYLEKAAVSSASNPLLHFLQAKSGNCIDRDKGSDILTLIETGEILRSERAKNTKLGHACAQYQEEGKFVPDELIFKIIEKCNFCKNIVFDGYPRNLQQGERYMSDLNLVNESGQIKLVPMSIVLEIDEKLATERILYRARKYEEDGKPVRSDDKNPAVIRARFQEFYDKTIPAIEYLQRQNIPFLKINANEDLFAVEGAQEKRKKSIRDFLAKNYRSLAQIAR